MPSYAITALRLVLIMSFLAAMPVLALPPVADWCEGQIYGQPSRRVIAARPLPTPAPGVASTGATDWPDEIWDASQAAFEVSVAQSPAGQQGDLTELARQVEALGASFYRLEHLQEQPPLYRFTAQFSEQGDVPRRWQHSATREDAASAMQQVIREIADHR
jgi:hypothetical protein